MQHIPGFKSQMTSFIAFSVALRLSMLVAALNSSPKCYVSGSFQSWLALEVHGLASGQTCMITFHSQTATNCSIPANGSNMRVTSNTQIL
eukprot:scaffold130067_cov18-Tisochrysis_lutea.AAC.1